MKRRMLSCLLLSSMLMTLLPAAAFAETLPDEIQAENAEFVEEYPEQVAEVTEQEEARMDGIELNEDPATSGTCGENLTWTLSNDG